MTFFRYHQGQEEEIRRQDGYIVVPVPYSLSNEEYKLYPIQNEKPCSRYEVLCLPSKST